MEQKARDNLNAAKLLRDEDFCDSSASRSYYSAYLAAWHYLLNIGIQPPRTDRGTYWPHHTFPEILWDNFKIIGPVQMEKFELLYSRRIKADYYIDRIEPGESDESLQIAADFVSFFLENKGDLE
jgi:uncharacterized protein (UPF0332 family)